MPARFDVKLTGYAFACGIQEKSEVSLRNDNRKRGNNITECFLSILFLKVVFKRMSEILLSKNSKRKVSYQIAKS